MNEELDLNIIRRQLGITAESLADSLGISYEEMSSILHNRRPMNNELIGKLYHLYGKKIFFYA